MSNYQQNKEIVRQQAIDYQLRASEQNMSYLELANWTEYFTKLGKRYGLLKEFSENGII